MINLNQKEHQTNVVITAAVNVRRIFSNMRTSILAVMLLASFSMAAQAQTPYQLSGDMVPFGDASYLNAISPDNKTVVYVADQDTDDVNELYSVALKGGAVTKLNSVLPMGFDVDLLVISSDSQYVVYRTRNGSTGKLNLFSVPIHGGSVVQLNTNNITYDLSDYRITNDGQRVVYKAYNANSDTALFSLPITGGTPVNITPSSQINPSLFNLTFFISPDDQRVIFTVRVLGNQPELFSVPVTGGTVVHLNRPLTTSPLEQVARFPAISPNSQTVVYAINNIDAGTTELYSTPISGGASVRISFDGSATNVDENGFKISPDSQRVVFNAEEIFGRKLLYTVPINGGTPIEIYPASGAVIGSEVSSNYFNISNDSQRVVYMADQGTDDVLELYSAPIVGASSSDVHATKLNATLPFSSRVFTFQISPDSKSVVYRADQDVFDELNIYHVPINGGSTTPLNTDLTLGGGILHMAISADSNQVVYYGDQDSDDVYELYRVPLTGGTVTKLNAPLPFGGNTYNFSISPKSDVVLYMADQDVFQDIELFAVGITEEEEMCLPIRANNGAVAVICL